MIWSLLLMKAESVLGALLALAVIAAAGTMFWFLVKAMARIQMPDRRRTERPDAASRESTRRWLSCLRWPTSTTWS